MWRYLLRSYECGGIYENKQNILTKRLELGDVWSTFFPVVKKFLANSPWSKVALVVVWVLHCRQKHHKWNTISSKVLWIIAKSWPGLYAMGFRILKLSRTLVPCFNGHIKITCPSYNFCNLAFMVRANDAYEMLKQINYVCKWESIHFRFDISVLNLKIPITQNASKPQNDHIKNMLIV